MTTKEILAQRLSQLREEAKIPRQKAANDLGISRNSLEYYEKGKLPKGHVIRKLQRWVNARAIFETIPRFEDYQANA